MPSYYDKDTGVIILFGLTFNGMSRKLDGRRQESYGYSWKKRRGKPSIAMHSPP